LSLPLGLSSISFTKVLSPAVTDEVSSVSLSTVEPLRSSIPSRGRGDSTSPSSPAGGGGGCSSSPSSPSSPAGGGGGCSSSPSSPAGGGGGCSSSPSSPSSPPPSPASGGCCSSPPSVTLPTKSIISLAVVILDNAFWPTAEGMPPTIGSSNNTKTVSGFIDIIYSLTSKKRYREY
jgi:hypothetical protein